MQEKIIKMVRNIKDKKPLSLIYHFVKYIYIYKT